MTAATGIAQAVDRTESGTPADAAAGAAKHDVVNDLGEQALLLPGLLNAGLEANDRAKYLLTLLQAARAHADRPELAPASLRDERLAAGVGDATLDDLVDRAVRGADGRYRIPRAGELCAQLFRAVGDMLEPLAVPALGAASPSGRESEPAGAARGDHGPERSRLDALAATAPDPATDELDGDYIDRLAASDRGAGDSVHLLVMDAHRALNRLQSEIATETLDGASVYHLAPADRPLVSAFMAGVQSTSALRFEHPGLGTTATRSGQRLLIQNDIGETAAHILIISVADHEVTVTYTDVHRQRLRFFRTMLDRYHVEWSGGRDGRGALVGDYHLATGRYVAPDDEALADYLRHLGSRLVFLIDWNRARRRLAPLVGKGDAVALLRWAADADLGHRAFLLLGAERLVYDAVELAVSGPPRYGEGLDTTLGRDVTIGLLRFAMRAASEGLRAGKSAQLIRDEVRVEVLHHVQAAQSSLLTAAAEHAGLIVETARALQAAVVGLGSAEQAGYAARAARRATGWEHRADDLLGDIRLRARRFDGAGPLAELITGSDDAIDDLEEALFLLTLLPAQAVAAARPALAVVSGVAVNAAKEHLKTVCLGADLMDDASADELEDFLVAVDAVGRLEHEADEADRLARADFVAHAPDFRSLYVADAVSRAIESATDALQRSALRLREQVLARAGGR